MFMILFNIVYKKFRSIIVTVYMFYLRTMRKIQQESREKTGRENLFMKVKHY